MARKAKTAAGCYTVVYERDESGWWAAHVREVLGCRTQGRSIEQARARIREALDLFDVDGENAELVDSIALPLGATVAAALARDRRDAASAAAERAHEALVSAARELVEAAGLSLRDAATVLAVSHQRVAQLLEERRPHRAVFAIPDEVLRARAQQPREDALAIVSKELSAG